MCAGADAAPGEKADIREQIRRVQFQRSKSGEQSAEQQPGDRGTVKEQDRQARGSVDQRAFDLFDFAGRHVRLRGRRDRSGHGRF